MSEERIQEKVRDEPSSLILPASAAGGLKDEVRLRGHLLIEVRGPDGELKDRKEFKNLVVSSGKAAIASRLAGSASAAATHMGVGTNNTAAAATDVALGTELTKAALTSTTLTNNAAVYVATFGAGVGTGAIVEAGLFNGNTAAATGLSYTRSGSTITVTKTSHGLALDRAVGIASATDSANNGGWTIKNPLTNTFDLITGAAGANGTLTLYQDIMYCRTVFSVVNKGASDTMTITWTVTIS
jgi:hypothetical protein